MSRFVDIVLAALAVAIAVKMSRQKNAWACIGAYWCIIALRNVLEVDLPVWAWMLLLCSTGTFLLLMACFNVSAQAEERALAERLIEHESESDILREAMEEEQW